MPSEPSLDPRPTTPAESATSLEDRRYRVLTETAPDAIITLDEHNRILSVNSAAERTFGWSAQEMLGQSLDMLMPEAMRKLHNAGMGRYVRTGEKRLSWHSVPVRALHKDGHEIPMEISFGEFVEDGRRVFAGFMRDVSDRVAQQELLAQTTRELEAALVAIESRVREAEAARESADEANAAKSRFLATMSHELRTPLNAIGGYVELLETGVRGELNEPQREDLRRIRRAQARLLALINDVLNFARLESGRVGYDIRDVPLASMLGSLGAMIEPQAREKRLRYTCEPGDPTVTACADAPKLEQILLNLLSNAVKFTPAGGEVALSVEADDEEVRISVRDTGRGIPADRLHAVFEPFVQLDAALTRQHEGTGLGLAISQDLARGMGGEISVDSAIGQGSTFTLVLPAGRPVSRAMPRPVSMGELLASEAQHIVRRVVSRLRADPEVPDASQPELEDHLASLVTDVAQLLVILDGAPMRESAPLIADGSRIQRMITKLHGAQRRRLGWTARIIEREFDYLGEEVAAALRRRAPDDPGVPLEETISLVRALLEEARSIAARSVAA